MRLKPWYDVVKPRQDLCEGRPLDASAFAVHRDKVRLKSSNISADYTDPRRFFARTFLTDTLVKMAGEVVRRLSGITTEASAIFNTMTQFGGGKTHALTLLYHLANCVLYHFIQALTENLNKRYNDRKATIQPQQIDELMRQTISQVFPNKIERVFFPDKSVQIGDRPVLTMVIMDTTRTMQDEKEALKFIDQLTRECGSSSRTFKSALIWVVADTTSPIREEARKLLAWRAIDEDASDLRLDEAQRRQLQQSLGRAERDLKESVWRHYKHVVLLGKDNTLRHIDLGLVNSSAAGDIVTLVLQRLKENGEAEASISPNILMKNWPPTFKDWPTKSVRDAFFASPLFPRLLNPESIKDTIVRGVQNSQLAWRSIEEQNR